MIVYFSVNLYYMFSEQSDHNISITFVLYFN